MVLTETKSILSSQTVTEEPDIEQLFRLCDQNGSGLIEASDLRSICSEALDDAEIDALITQLDRSGQGAISKEDFNAGYSNLLSAFSVGRSRSARRLNAAINVAFDPSMANFQSRMSPSPSSSGIPSSRAESVDLDPELITRIETDLALLRCQDEVVEIYRALHAAAASGNTAAAEACGRFETFVISLMRDVRDLHTDNVKLEQFLAKEREEHQRQLSELERESELQVADVECKVRSEERGAALRELLQIRETQQAEINELTHKLKRLESAERAYGEQQANDSLQLDEVKQRLEQYIAENRRLFVQLNEQQTESSLIRSQLKSARVENEQKSVQLEMQNQNLQETIEQQRVLAQQLQLLQEANRRLSDNNDDLRWALEKKLREERQRSQGQVNFDENDSMLSSYLQQAQNFRPRISDPPPSVDAAGTSAIVSSSSRSHGSLRSRISTRSSILGSDVGSSVSQRAPRFNSRYSTVQSDNTSRRSETAAVSMKRYRLIMCGDSCVGKTSFVTRLCDDAFFARTQTTLGVDYKKKILYVDQQPVELQIWDTAGQERFRSISKSYYRGADGVILSYDCMSESSFLNVRQWIDSVKESAQSDIALLIIGNKLDLKHLNPSVAVPFNAAKQLAQEYQADVVEVSAKTGENVIESVELIAKRLQARENNSQTETGMRLHESNKKDEKEKPFWKCCDA